jgi:Ca2+-binding RTX toxin-like protein
MESPANNLYSLATWSPFGTYPFSCEPTDQRGEPRSADGGAPSCDAGAFELVECRGLVATITGTDEGDRLVGTKGRDVIHGSFGDDTIRSGGGDDVICGGAGDDRIVSGGGHDQVQGGLNGDKVRAGRGDDYVRGLQPGGPGIEIPKNITAPGFDDLDTLSGGPGDDRLLGEADADRLSGGPGRDRIDGGELKDECDGGPHRDRLRSCEKRG